MEVTARKRYKYWEEINEAVLRQIPQNRSSQKNTVLDVGCGTGALSEAIEKKGYNVWGIELDTEAMAICRERITRVIHADLTQIDSINREIGNQLFDYLIFADVLEHLSDPLFILKYYLKFLKDDGYLVVSLPNVLAWANRVMFLFGRFEYTDTGLLEKDHLRFFTFRTAKLLVKSAGCSITKTDYIPYFVRVAEPLIKKILLRGKKLEDTHHQMLVSSPYYQWYMKYINPIEYVLGYWNKSLFAFKMIIIAKKG